MIKNKIVNKIAIACFLIVLTVVGVICMDVYADRAENENESAINIGISVRNSAEELKNSRVQPIFDFSETMSLSLDDDIAMVIMDKAVSKEYFNYRMALFVASGDENPMESTKELMKKQIVEWEFAEEKGILPSETEIREYCDSIRTDANSDDENRNIMLGVVNSMGMTESEYFDEFQPVYEVPFIIISQKVEEYCTKNNISVPDWKNVRIENINVKTENDVLIK